MARPIDPSQSYVFLDTQGSSRVVEGGPSFWENVDTVLAPLGRGWLVTEFECDGDWANWEMHPHADEFVYLLSGDADFVLDLPAGREVVPLAGRAAVVVPRGVWHTAKVRAPSRMLFVTMGDGTEHRPA